MRLKDKIKLSLRILLSKQPGNFLREKYKSKPKILTEYIPSVVYDNKLLSGKNALITGAGQNIGKNIAIEMAKQGANIYFTDIEEQKCIDLEKILREYKIKFKGYVSDVSKTMDIDNLVKDFSKLNINIDILVNNVGVNFNKDKFGTNNFNIEDWKRTYETNVFGPMHLTKRISDSMIKENISGSIIFITSVHQEIVGNWPNYSSSKAALGMIIKELAAELAENNIRVNGIAPGGVQIDKNNNPIPNKHYKLNDTSIEPQHIGRAAVYLASEYFSKYTTGIIIKIDSGHTLYHLPDKGKFNL